VSRGQYLLFISLFVVRTLLVFGSKYLCAFLKRAHAIPNDAMYPALAEQVVEVQSELSARRGVTLTHRRSENPARDPASPHFAGYERGYA
jgi:hypothetical protein